MTTRKLRAKIEAAGTRGAPLQQLVTLTRGDGEIVVLRDSKAADNLKRAGWKEKA